MRRIRLFVAFLGVAESEHHDPSSCGLSKNLLKLLLEYRDPLVVPSTSARCLAMVRYPNNPSPTETDGSVTTWVTTWNPETVGCSNMAMKVLYIASGCLWHVHFRRTNP